MHRIHLPGLIAGLVVLSSVLLGGCGGGGGGGSDTANANPPSNSGNSAPTISGAPGSSAVVGQSYSFQPSASDANGDQLTFTVANLPGWATLNASTGRISGTPTSAQVGAYGNITISVSDGTANASLAPFSVTVSEVGSGSATLSWTPPTQNSDGSALSDLTGYQVLYGRNEGSLDQFISLDNPSINTYVVENLSSGTWYFAIVAVNSAGVTSPLSNVGNKTIS